jgi:toxin YxiD
VRSFERPDIPRRLGEYALAAEEFQGGHTVERHVGKSDEELRERLDHPPYPEYGSSFTDLSVAAGAVRDIVADGRAEIRNWLETAPPDEPLLLHGSFPFVTGRSVGESDVRECHAAKVVLFQDGGEYVVRTAYPIRDEDRNELR